MKLTTLDKERVRKVNDYLLHRYDYYPIYERIFDTIILLFLALQTGLIVYLLLTVS